MRITTDAAARALEVERQRRERVRREARERARAAPVIQERNEGRELGRDEPGVEESKGDAGNARSDGPQDWEQCVCEMSGLPYYYSPSRQRSSWTAPGTSRDEEMEFDDFLESRGRASSGFGAVNPLHGN